MCHADKVNIHVERSVAIHEFPLKSGHDFADYPLYNNKAVSVIKAKKEGVILTCIETQSDKYTQGLPDILPRRANPLLFLYQPTGSETGEQRDIPMYHCLVAF